jgi:hypothetical protein
MKIIADSLHEVGFAHAGSTVKEEGVVGAGGVVCDGEGGGVGELIIGADNEILKEVSFIKAG